jgi:hypothetical protein
MADSLTPPPRTPKRIGVAADHGGFESKAYLAGMLREAHYEVVDFGDAQLAPADDYPDFVVPWPVQLLRARWIEGSLSAGVAWVRALPPIRCGMCGRA